MKKLLMVALGLLTVLAVVGCQSDADVVSANLSKSADQFQVLRRVVFYNGITGDYMLTIEGYCSLGNSDAAGSLSVTCDVGNGQYKKNFLGLSDNVTYFVEQLDGTNVSKDHYLVVFKPTVIIPNVVQ